jgi:hypothetical protein
MDDGRLAESIRRLRTKGITVPEPARFTLSAGPLTVDYSSGSVRDVRVNGDEVIRQVYFALRDRNWNTISGVISEEKVEVLQHGFLVKFVSTHESGPIKFAWKGEIRGDREGRVTFTLDGKALTTFQRNRIGFCVLHPMEIAGTRCRVTHTDGTIEHSFFPDLVSPHQPFREIRKIHYAASERAEVTIELEGDVFEMEDQRNWTDASFKTYSTPLDMPFPIEQLLGSSVRQSVTIIPSAWKGASNRPTRTRAAGVIVTLTPKERFRLPRLGLTWRPVASGSFATVRDKIRAVRPEHLRFDMHPGGQPQDELRGSLAAALQVEIPLELALFLGNDVDADLASAVLALAKTGALLARILVFQEGRKSTPAATLRSAKSALGPLYPGVEFCGGTDAFFAELNRERPDMGVADGLTFSLNPQVHVFDNASLVESLAAQGAVIRSARVLSTGKPVHVSPVTFRMRWNPNAMTTDKGSPSFDPRQLSLFGASWTAGSIRTLGLAGADSVTYFDTVGSTGIMEEEHPSLPRELFPSVPGGVFPLYYVFLELGQLQGGEGLKTQSNEPLMANALAVENGGRLLVAISNYMDYEIVTSLRGVEGQVKTKYLEALGYDVYSASPAAYFEERAKIQEAREGLELRLPPNGMVFVSQ